MTLRRRSASLAALVVAAVVGVTPPLAAQRVPLVLNHLVIVLDSATYHDVRDSPFINSDFAATERDVQSGFDSGSGVRLMGKYNFLMFAAPGSAPGRWPAHLGIVLSTALTGGLAHIATQGTFADGGFPPVQF
ncbi:MAG: hypothetical protein ACRELE_11920, partial [Gemmatimonadales bacterium]